MPLEVFYSYAHEDEKLRDQLDKHLSLLQRKDLIVGWHDRRIPAGDEWAGEIDEHINTAQIILLLISADFIGSKYCYEQEMQIALARHTRREAVVIPIILRPVDWKGAPFGHLQALPRDAKPVTTWLNQDEAFTDIAEKIREAVLRFPSRVQTPRPAATTEISTTPYTPKPRVLDAGIPSYVVKGEPTDLLVMIRLPQSTGLAGKLLSGDEAGVDPEEVQSKDFSITFPVDFNGSPQPLKIAVDLTSPDFAPPHQSKNIFVPPDGDSEPCRFMLVPVRLGKLKVLVELRWEDAMQRQKSLITECVAVAVPQAAQTMNVVQIPIEVKMGSSAARGGAVATASRPSEKQPQRAYSPPLVGSPVPASRAPTRDSAQLSYGAGWERQEQAASSYQPSARMRAPQSAKRSSGMTAVIVAAIAAVPLILGSYWQFVYKPQREAASARMSASQPPLAPIVISGQVLNAKTKAVVPDAQVTVNLESAGGPDLGPLTKYTDSDGSFHFSLNGVKPQTNARISVRADNFNPLVQEMVLQGSATGNELRITPLEKMLAPEQPTHEAKPAQQPFASTRMITGRVVDSKTNLPIGQVQITLGGRTETYLTDDNGNFQIAISRPADDQPLRLLARKAGCLPLDQIASARGESNLMLQLHCDAR